jgi:hypothetical protein
MSALCLCKHVQHLLTLLAACLAAECAWEAHLVMQELTHRRKLVTVILSAGLNCTVRDSVAGGGLSSPCAAGVDPVSSPRPQWQSVSGDRLCLALGDASS